MTIALLGSLAGALLGWLMGFLSLFLILLILIQRGKGGGLTGALGGPGGQSAFGSKAGDTFTVITIVVASIWGFTCAFTMWLLGAHTPTTLTETTVQAGPDDVETGPPPVAPPIGGDGIGSFGAGDEDGAPPETDGAAGTPSMELTPAPASPSSGSDETGQSTDAGETPEATSETADSAPSDTEGSQ